MIIQELDKRIISLSKKIKGQKILDLGCGLNKYKKYFEKDNKFIGIDIEVSGRELIDKKPDIFYDGKTLPFDDEEFDIIICLEVLEHVVYLEKFLQEMKRVLKFQGTLYLSVPFITAEHEVPFDFRRFTSYGINQKLEELNFEVINHEKILFGHNAIRQLLYGEMHRFEKQNNVNVLAKFFIKQSFRVLFRILGYFYRLDRVFFDNFLEAKKK